MSSQELEPCPLCGGAAELRRSDIPYSTGFRALCEPCGLEITRVGSDLVAAQTRVATIAAWNRRAPQQEPHAPITIVWAACPTTCAEGAEKCSAAGRCLREGQPVHSSVNVVTVLKELKP